MINQQEQINNFTGPSYTRMSPHPNITPIVHAFADNIPCLPDALTSYPAALPFNNGGFARNRTMFFVMPRLVIKENTEDLHYQY